MIVFLHELHQPVESADFGRHVVRLLAEAIPGTTVAFDEIDPPTGAYRLSHNSQMAPDALGRHFQRLTEVYQQNPIHDYIMAGGTDAVKISDLRPQSEIRRTEFYQDFFKPIGLEYQISLPLPGCINALSINSDRDFAPELVVWLGLATDHIALAHANARRFSRLATALNGDRHLSASDPLTPREDEILGWVREGKRNPEIALILGISFRTVEKHVENILRKTHTETHTETRTAAARTASSSRRTEESSPGTTGVIERH